MKYINCYVSVPLLSIPHFYFFSNHGPTHRLRTLTAIHAAFLIKTGCKHILSVKQIPSRAVA